MESSTNQIIKGHRFYKLCWPLLIILILLGSAIAIKQVKKSNIERFVGNWEISMNEKGDCQFFIISNISIYSSNGLVLIAIRGEYLHRTWGPVIMTANYKDKQLLAKPSENLCLPGFEVLTGALSKPFSIHYSSEHDRIILHNAFFKRSNAVVWSY